MYTRKLRFYDIDSDYIFYLKQFDPQVPNIGYKSHEKFFCGIVLSINDFDYFVPVSSLNSKQRTNIVIYDKERPISSLRFSFMLPAFSEVLHLKDFSSESQKYKDLVNAEIKFCNRNREKIYKKALEVYKIGINKNHPLNYTCCDFRLLEEKARDYMHMKGFRKI